VRIAILGATSHIATDLVLALARRRSDDLMLFARRPHAVMQWLTATGLTGRCGVADFAGFGPQEHFDAVLNFVGVGDPAAMAATGASIFDVTLQYDDIALQYLRKRPDCRYLFLSSGAAYGAAFDQPVDRASRAMLAINSFEPQDWYAVAKLHAEARHRSLSGLPIVDVRVFNYFSRTQDISGSFLIADMLRAIRDRKVLSVTSDYIVRDFIDPADFYGLVIALLTAPAANAVVDCYSLAPIDKPTLLSVMQQNFGLQYRTADRPIGINATGNKPHYYSRNTRAGDFGYRPAFSSVQTILLETSALLQAAPA